MTDVDLVARIHRRLVEDGGDLAAGELDDGAPFVEQPADAPDLTKAHDDSHPSASTVP